MSEYYQINGAIFITSIFIFMVLVWGEKTTAEDLGLIPGTMAILVFLSLGLLLGGAVFQTIGWMIR